MKTLPAVLAVSAVAMLALSGCGGGGDVSEEDVGDGGAMVISDCEAAVAELAAANNDEDYQLENTFEADDEALMACEDLESFEAAVEQHPDAILEGSPETLVANRCADSADLDGATICEDVE